MNKIRIVLLLLLPFLFFSCNKVYDSSKHNDINNSVVSVPKETKVMKLGFSTGMNDPRAMGSILFKNLVEQRTNNKIIVEIYSDGQLGSDMQLIQGLFEGTVDLVITSAGNYTNYIPKAGLSALPYLFDNFEDAWTFMDSSIIHDINTYFEQENIYVLSYFDNGFRCITTTEEFGPINKLEDINNLLIRTPNNQIVMETMISLGARPKVSPFTTLKDDIRNNKFQAQENPIPVIFNSGLYEVQKNIAITNHSYDAMPLTIRKDLWDSLDFYEQKTIKDAAIEAQNYNRSIVKQQTIDYVISLEEKGMNVTYPDLSTFKKSTVQVLNFFEPIYGKKLINQIKEQNNITQ